MFNSVLYATHNVSKRDPDIDNIILNPETIAINQDLSPVSPVSFSISYSLYICMSIMVL